MALREKKVFMARAMEQAGFDRDYIADALFVTKERVRQILNSCPTCGAASGNWKDQQWMRASRWSMDNEEMMAEMEKAVEKEEYFRYLREQA